MKYAFFGIILSAICPLAHAELEGVFAASSPKYGNRNLTGVTVVLSAGIEERLTLSKNVKGIHALDLAIPFETSEYNYLYLRISLYGDFGFEGVWHGYKLARKKKLAPDWRGCDLYTPSTFYPTDCLGRLYDKEILGICSEHYEPRYADLAQRLTSLSTQQDRAAALEQFRAGPAQEKK